MEVFYILGGALAGWALIVTAIGLRSESFPRSGAAEKGVAAISVLLVAGAIGSGIIAAANEEEEGGEATAAEIEGGLGETAGEPASGAEDEDPGGSQAGGAEEPGSEQSPEEELEEPAGGGEGKALQLVADPGGAFAFDTEELDAPAGTVSITMENPSAIPHNVALEGNGVSEQGDTVGNDGTSTVTTELEPGDYTYFCSVAGHREGGMEGTLTVE